MFNHIYSNITIMSILRNDELDFKKINYNKPEKQGVIYYSSMNYDNKPFYLQTPKMVCKNGFKDIIDSNNSLLDLEPVNMDYSFYDSLLSLDEKNVKCTFENNKDWFGKNIPLEIIDNMYKRNNKPVKKNSKPRFSFKVPMIKRNAQCQIYDQKKICVDFEKIQENTEVVLILHVKGLKFLKQHYYCDIYISQIKVFLDGSNKYSILDNYAFNDKEEEEAELKSLEKELMLDSDFIQGFRKEEKEKISNELRLAKEQFESQQKIIKDLENRLRNF